jgi:hypothetical protein
MIFHLYGDITITGEFGQQNLGLCSACRAFEQGGIFIDMMRILSYNGIIILRIYV